MRVTCVPRAPRLRSPAAQLTSEAVVGIDLGTTFSAVAVCVAGKVTVVEVRTTR
jgi:molecular chaperone DnaK (HSP70)